MSDGGSLFSATSISLVLYKSQKRCGTRHGLRHSHAKRDKFTREIDTLSPRPANNSVAVALLVSVELYARVGARKPRLDEERCLIPREFLSSETQARDCICQTSEFGCKCEGGVLRLLEFPSRQ